MSNKSQNPLVISYEAIQDKMMALTDAFTAVLPRNIDPARFIRIGLNAIRQNPAVLRCDRMSILGSMMTVAQLGLMVDGVLGQAYLIPYKNQCQALIGYRGFIQLGYNTGVINNIYAKEVFKGDHYRAVYGTDKSIEHWETPDTKRSDENIERVYAVVKFQNGMIDFHDMTRDEINYIRDTMSGYSKMSPDKRAKSPWSLFYGAMARKTVIRPMWKTLPLTTDAISSAATLDELGELGKQRNAAVLLEHQDKIKEPEFQKELHQLKEQSIIMADEEKREEDQETQNNKADIVAEELLTKIKRDRTNDKQS